VEARVDSFLTEILVAALAVLLERLLLQLFRFLVLNVHVAALARPSASL
jgi:hypothetical protein